MSNTQEEHQSEVLDAELFWTTTVKHIEEGMAYRDAIDLSAVIMGGRYALLASQAIGKYQEATHPKTELSKEERVDEYALASMGELWHGENFNGSTQDMDCSKEEVFTDSIYFLLKYTEEYGDNALPKILEASQNVCGDKAAREATIRFILDHNNKEQ